MAKSSKYNRARIRSRVRRPRRRGGSMVWNVAIAAIVIVGVVAIALSVSNRRSSAEVAPKIGDHIHSYLGVNVCGTWLAAAPAFEQQADEPTLTAGLHSHGDGLMHFHPFSSSEAGTRATVGRYLDYGGWDLSETSMRLWDGPTHKNGQKCGTGADARPATIQWKVGRYQEPWPDEARSGNPADYRPKNGDIVAIYFVPKGDPLEEPPDATTALANITDIGGSVDGSPAQTETTVITGAPGDAGTTAPSSVPQP